MSQNEMSNPLPNPNSQKWVESLDSMSDSQLVDLLLSINEVTVAGMVQGLRSMAVVVKKLEDRKVDLSDLKIDVINHVRLIANGQLLPEILALFSGKGNRLIRAVSSLPIPDQKKLAKGDPVRLAVYAPDGSITFSMINPLYMMDSHVKQAFYGSHIRNDAEQIAYLHKKRTEAKRIPIDETDIFRIDHERKGVTLKRGKGSFVTLDELVTVVKALQE